MDISWRNLCAPSHTRAGQHSDCDCGQRGAHSSALGCVCSTGIQIRRMGFFHEFSGWVDVSGISGVPVHRPSRHAFDRRAKGGRHEEPSFLDSCRAARGTALMLHARGNTDLIPASEPLSQVPRDDRRAVGKRCADRPGNARCTWAGEFLSRDLHPAMDESPPIGLFIGYFPTQRTGVTIHSPKHCLPGAGWAFESSQYVNLKDANGKAHQVGEYIIANGENQSIRYLLVPGPRAKYRQ